MTSTLLVAMFCVLVFQRESLAEENFGYLQNAHLSASGYSCTKEPLPGECSFNHSVANTGSTRVGSILKTMFDILNTTIKGHSANFCIASIKKFFCKRSFQLNCTDEFIYQDIQGIKTSCNTAEKDCEAISDVQAQIFIRSMINCSESIFPVPAFKRPRLTCERFPEVIPQDPLPCAKRNYKVMVSNFTERARTQVAFHERLVRVSDNISEKCLSDVREMICKMVVPACDRNETVAVVFVSRQECERIISCLNTTANVTRLKKDIGEWCRHSSDGNTAKRIPLSLVYTKFEDNTTKDTTTPTKESPTGKTGNQTATEKPPYHNTTRCMSSEKQPRAQGNTNKGNTTSPSTKTSVFNGTIEEKNNTTSDEGVPNPNMNETTRELESSKMNKTISNVQNIKVNPTPSFKRKSSICVLNPNKTTGGNQAASVVQKATSRVTNGTSPTFRLTNLSVPNASFHQPINATERQVLSTVSNSKNVEIQGIHGNNSAPLLNAGTKGLPVSLFISILTVYMW
ncbi:uncharacterized protein LOC114522566 [Dendronephthya gigantea]|uniref:uncharacterized protein LOC114522566 n=1 Tax=Dendronephthya gigantea TaxID=151771 RepID=UPI00106D5A13|nr:uncharacterized protein LOC114522566 [Dendronephthya gigantea]